MNLKYENMKPASFLILATCFCFLSCKKSDDNSDLIIKAGFICGWGSGTDSIEISKTTIKYVYYIPAKSNLPEINKSRTVPDSEWAEILSCVNTNDFVKLQYQTCNVCIDGCDEWIFIQENNITHKITFDKGFQIYAINKLQKKLAQLRAEFNK